MKRIIAFILLVILTSQCPCTLAAQEAYTAVLDTQFARVEINDGFNIIKTTDDAGLQALYSYEGKKISSDYDYIGEFDNTLALARKSDKYYIINYQGSVVGEFADKIIGFSDGIVFKDLSGITDDRPLSYYEGKFALCRPDGTELVQLDYADHTARNVYGTMAFYKGLLLTFAEGKVGAMGTDGNMVIPAVYDELSIDGAGELIIAAKDGKYGLLNRFGEKHTEFEYDHIRELPVEGKSYYVTCKNGLYGLLGQWGSVIIPPQLDFEPERVFPDYRLIQMSVPNTRGDKDEYGVLYGLADYSGNEIIPPIHTQIVAVSQGTIAAAKAYDKGGFYTTDGAELTEFCYRMLSGYRGGYAFASACSADGSWEHYVFNIKGEVEFEPENHSSGYFGGLACINGKKLIDTRGDVVVDFTGTDMRIVPNYYWQSNSDGMYVVKIGEKYGVIRCVLPKENPVWDFEYVDFGNVKYVEKFAGGYSFAMNDGTNRYLDLEGNPTDETEVYGQMPDDSFFKELATKGMIITYVDNDTMELIDIDGNVIVADARHIEYLGKDVFCVIYGWDTQLVRSDGTVIAANLQHYTKVGDNGYIGISTPEFEGYINTSGRYVLSLPAGYYVQGAFSEGLASVVQDIVYTRYGKVSYINEQGEIALQPDDNRWVYGGEFENGLAVVGTHLGKGGPECSMLVRCVYDTPSEWATDIIAQAMDASILTEELAVGYRRSITRERFCELVYQLPYVNEKEIDTDSISFADTDNRKILHLCSMGIINGVGDGRFEPDSYLSREQAATILSRLYAHMGKATDMGGEPFADDADISDWAKASVYAMKNAGIVNGVGDNSFAPQDTYTTEQAVATIMRVYQ